MIIFKDICKKYSSKDFYSVDNVNLEIKPGEVFGFLGPNGAGKSTTIHMMTSQLLPTSGSISVFGYDTIKESLKVKEIIGFVNDEPLLYYHMTGRRYLKFIASIFKLSKEDFEEEVEYWSNRLSLSKDLDVRIREYSHGMKQKLSIIAALIHKPKLFVLDEPLVGLDPKSSREVKDIMKEYASMDNIVFFSTHVLEVAQEVCTKLSIIDKGKIKFNGTLEELRNLQNNKDASLEDLFLELTEKEN